jgi:subtilisin family serine protease
LEGGYITLDGQRIDLTQHSTDFQVIGNAPAVSAALLPAKGEHASRAVRSGPGTYRMQVASTDCDNVMEEVRKDAVASHVYVNPTTGEELSFTKRVAVRFTVDSEELLSEILTKHHLRFKGLQGGEYVLELSEAAVENPLKIANRIAEVEGVEYAQPEQMVSLQMHAAPSLLPRQWYLTAVSAVGPDVRPEAGASVRAAWATTRGASNIVVAVIDDEFQLDHPCFAGKTIHPDRRDFSGDDRNPEPGTKDYHGTPVASIAVGSDRGGGMSGVAPGCTFLPIRIGFGGSQPFDMLEVFRYVSARADVVNCRFSTPPSSMQPFSPGFRSEIAQMTVSGGRRGTGLVMIFSAANDGVPTSLQGSKNWNGIRFTGPNGFGETVGKMIPKGLPVFTGYPLIPGVIVVGACPSLMRKSGYSNWGQQITVVAPSNNLHCNMSFLRPTDPLRAPFVANYRGLGQIAASNRPPGAPFDRMPDNRATTTVVDSDYTNSFGGTSGAAPVVAGVAALMLSANPDLTPAQGRNILMATADRDLDTTLDLPSDPNILPNLGGQRLGFVNGRSVLFGSGKVNAGRAVVEAKALVVPIPAAAPSFGAREK